MTEAWCTLREGGEAIAAWGSGFVVEVVLRVIGVDGAITLVEHVTPRGHRLDAGALERVRRVVSIAYRLSPIPGTCLRRSLLEYGLARARGLDVRFMIGVRRQPDFAAHAWVEMRDERSAEGDGFTVLVARPESPAR